MSANTKPRHPLAIQQERLLRSLFGLDWQRAAARIDQLAARNERLCGGGK